MIEEIIPGSEDIPADPIETREKNYQRGNSEI